MEPFDWDALLNAKAPASDRFVVADRFKNPPLPDPRTPELPYRVGEVFTALRHDPLPPYGRDYCRQPERWMTAHAVLIKRTQLEHCLMNALSDGKVHPQTSRQLRITKELRAGAGCGAQVVVVNDSHVAKIYDPLYYSYVEQFDDSVPVDVVYKSNSEYVRECAAYEALDSSLGGKEIPKYYGSWTINLPIDVPGYPTTRAARLVLLEYIQGPSLHTISPSDFSRSEMSKLMVRVLDAHLAVRNHGVVHRDFAPRNVLWVSSDLKYPNVDSEFRVCLIDFALSYVPAHDITPRFTLPEQTPKECYWDDGLGEFKSLLPLRDHELRIWLGKHW